MNSFQMSIQPNSGPLEANESISCKRKVRAVAFTCVAFCSVIVLAQANIGWGQAVSATIPSTDIANPRLDAQLIQCLKALQITTDPTQAKAVQTAAGHLLETFLKIDRTGRSAWTDYPVAVQIAGYLPDTPYKTKAIDAWLRLFKSTKESNPPSAGLLKLAKTLIAAKRPEQVATVAGAAVTTLSADRTTKIPMRLSEAADYVELSFLTNDDVLKAAAKKVFTPYARQDDKSIVKLAPPEVLRLVATLTLQEDAAGIEQLRALVARVYLSKNLGIEPHQYVSLLSWLADSTDVATRNQTAQDLRERVTSSVPTGSSFTRDEAAHLIRLASKLGAGPEQESLAGQTAASQLCIASAWSGLSHDDQWSLIAASLGNDNERSALESRATAAETANTIILSQYQAVSRLDAVSGHVPDSEAWAGRATDRFLDKTGTIPTLSEVDFERLLGLMTNSHLILTREQTDRLLTTASRLDAAPHLLTDKLLQTVALLCEAHQARGRLDDHFGEAGGKSDLTTLKILAWIRRGEGTIRRFVHEVHKSLPSEKGDQYAQVKLAEAYAEGLTNKDEVRRTDGLEEYHQALTAAKSDAVRLEALTEYVAACRDQREYQEPIQVIAGLKSAFTTDQSAYLDQLTKELTAADAAKSRVPY